MVADSVFVMVYAVVLSVALVGGALYWGYSVINRLREQQASLAADLAAALRQVEALAALVSKSGVRIGRVERDCAQVADRIDLIELRGEARPYNQAIDSARNGTDPEKLARQFGLSTHEANLLMLVHGARSGSA